MKICVTVGEKNDDPRRRPPGFVNYGDALSWISNVEQAAGLVLADLPTRMWQQCAIGSKKPNPGRATVLSVRV